MSDEYDRRRDVDAEGQRAAIRRIDTAATREKTKALLEDSSTSPYTLIFSLSADNEAALDEIDRLRAENERLRAALKPFAEYMHTPDGRIDLDHLGNEIPDQDGVGWIYLTHGDFRHARAALKGGEDD